MAFSRNCTNLGDLLSRSASASEESNFFLKVFVKILLYSYFLLGVVLLYFLLNAMAVSSIILVHPHKDAVSSDAGLRDTVPASLKQLSFKDPWVAPESTLFPLSHS